VVGWLIAPPGPRGPVGLESGAMPDLKNIQSIYLVLAFIVPGMIIAFVRAQFLTRAPTGFGIQPGRANDGKWCKAAFQVTERS
jgi:hypothetical protein